MFVRVVCFICAVLCFVAVALLPLLATYLSYEGPSWIVREVAYSQSKGVPSTLSGSCFIAAVLLALSGIASTFVAFNIKP